MDLEQAITSVQGREKKFLLDCLEGMLRWKPKARMNAFQLRTKSIWLRSQLPEEPSAKDSEPGTNDPKPGPDDSHADTAEERLTWPFNQAQKLKS